MSACGSSAASLDDLLKKVECPICIDLPLGHIIQCRNGHSICERHFQETRTLSNCPVCRVPYSGGRLRNIVAEELVSHHRRQQQLNCQPTRGATMASSSSSTSIPIRASSALPVPFLSPILYNGNSNNASPCKYTKDGCDFECVGITRVRQHEQTCHFRPVTCCLSSDGCNNAEVSFFDYISHLTGLHGVKYLQGSHHMNKYLVKRDHKKLVRDGSTSVFILEVANQPFIVRAKQIDDWILVWVAFHGHPDHGKMYKAEIQYNFQYEDNTGPNHTPRFNLNRPYRGPSSSGLDDDDDIFTGNVVATSRQTWEEVRASRKYLAMPVSNVEFNLKRDMEAGRSFFTESWAVAITITRDQQPQPQA